MKQEIVKELEKLNKFEFDYDGNYIPDEEFELYWKYTKDI